MLSWGILIFTAQFLTCLLILFQRRDPVSSTAWIFFVLLFPFLGMFLFFLLGYFPFERKKRRIKKYRGKQNIVRGLSPLPSRKSGYKTREEELDDLLQQEELINTTLLLENLTGQYMTHSNSIQILVDGKQKYEVLEQKLRAAQKYIIFQYFIFDADWVGEKFRDLLIQKAREGVQIYFLYDHLANLFLPGKFLRPMKRAGIHVERFSPVYSVTRRFQFNFRNHRKLVVIDGEYAFTGGLNIGREYLGENKKLKGWRDNHFLVQGEVVPFLENSFREDWFFATNKTISLPSPENIVTSSTQQKASIQAIPSGPNDFIEVKHLTFIQLIQSAQKTLWIQTPYFIPDNSLLRALQLASLKGVDVRIMVPAIAQYSPIYYASHSFFPELINAGVNIYRYEPCFMHSKTCIIDDTLCLVGSTNLDNRSFKLNFELDLFVVSKEFNRELKSIFHADLVRSKMIDLKKLKELQFPRLLLTNFWRLFAPTL